MLVGIDASRAVTDSPTGTENYSRELITALLQAESPYRFRLYTRSNPPLDLFPPTGNYDVRVMPLTRAWTHARLSGEMLTHPPNALFVPSHVLPLIHPRQSLVTVHDLGYLYFPRAHRLLDRLYLDLSTRWNVRTAAHVIAISNATRADVLRAYRAEPSKLHVVYPGFDREKFRRVRDRDRISQTLERYRVGQDYVLVVGTLHPRKNYIRLMQAFRALPEKYDLVIAGKKGWLYNTILASVRQLGLESRVKFLGYVQATDLSVLYSGAHACVYPSLHEGFGFPVLEAQACEVPLACSNRSSLPEVAGDAAEFFDPLGVESMTRAVSRILENERRRAELIEKGLANVERFSWSRAARQILEIISGA